MFRITKCSTNFKRGRWSRSSRPGQPLQPPGAGLIQAVAHRWVSRLCRRSSGALRCRAREALPLDGSPASPIGGRGVSQQAALTVVALPGQQRRLFCQPLRQRSTSLSWIMRSCLRDRPLEAPAEALGRFGGEVLRTGEAVLTGEQELRGGAASGQVAHWETDPRTRAMALA